MKNLVRRVLEFFMHYEELACLGRRCYEPGSAQEQIAHQGGWLNALASLPRNVTSLLVGDSARNCVRHCNHTAMACSADHPGEMWNAAGGIDHLSELPSESHALLHFLRNASDAYPAKLGYVPNLLPGQELQADPTDTVQFKWRHYQPKHRMPVLLPCSVSAVTSAARLP